MKPVHLAFVSMSLGLAACAGSANHEVVTTHQAGDQGLSCQALEAEIIRTQVVVDGVQKDKQDLSGADVVDGVLWFPFNLIAKNSNYKASLEAADGRIARLESLKTSKDCTVSTAQDRSSRTSSVAGEISRLNDLYKSGALTESEYKRAKEKVLADL